jgi:hypothetical protein
MVFTEDEITFINKCRLLEERGKRLNTGKYKLLNQIFFLKSKLALARENNRKRDWLSKDDLLIEQALKTEPNSSRDSESHMSSELQGHETDGSNNYRSVANGSNNNRGLIINGSYNNNGTIERAGSFELVPLEKKGGLDKEEYMKQKIASKAEKKRLKLVKQDLAKHNLSTTMARAGLTNKIWHDKSLQGTFKLIKNSTKDKKGVIIGLMTLLLPKLINYLLKLKISWKYKAILYVIKPFASTACAVLKLCNTWVWRYYLFKLVISVVYKFTWNCQIKRQCKRVLGKQLHEVADIRNGYIKDEEVTALSIIANKINGKWWMKILAWFSFMKCDLNDVELLARSEMNKKMNVKAKKKILEQREETLAKKMLKEKKPWYSFFGCSRKTKDCYIELNDDGKKVAKELVTDALSNKEATEIQTVEKKKKGLFNWIKSKVAKNKSHKEGDLVVNSNGQYIGRVTKSSKKFQLNSKTNHIFDCDCKDCIVSRTVGSNQWTKKLNQDESQRQINERQFYECDYLQNEYD